MTAPPGIVTSSSGRTREYVVTAGTGIGVGKVRDGQVVFRVLRFLDKLREDGALSRELDRREMMEIVDVFARRVEYSTSHERFSKFFLRDLFAILDTAGVLSNGYVAPYSVSRSEEVMGESILPRIFGWRAQLGVEHSSLQSEFHGSYQSFRRSALDFAVPAIEYGYSISLNTHFHSTVSARVPLNGEQSRSDVDGSASISYELGERIETILTWSYDAYSNPPPGYSGDISRSISRNLTLGSNYFIEDHVVLNITTGYRNSDWYRSYSPSMSEYSNSQSSLFLTFGLTYRIF